MYTIENAKTILERKFSGSSLDDIRGISDFTVFQEAAANLVSFIDPLETQRTSEINLYADLFDYSAPSDLKKRKVIDIRPQSNRTSRDDMNQTYTEEFDRDKNQTENWFSVESDDGTKFLRINRKLSNSIPVTSVVSSEYAATSGVSNIAEDTILQFGEGKSVRFDVASGSNLLTWTGSAIDLDLHEKRSSLFLEVYWPDSTKVTSITLRIGSSASDYYEIVGSIHRGSIRTGKNIYRFDWDGATETGSVDETAIDYVRYAIVMSSLDTDIRIGKLYSKLPTPHEIVYYSKSLFRPAAGGTWLSIPTSDTDIVNLDSDAFNIFIYECCAVIANDTNRDSEKNKYIRELGRDPGSGLLTGGGLYGKYKADSPSEATRPSSTYYQLPTPRRYINRRR